MALTEEKEQKNQRKERDNMFRCNKVGHYSNECKEEFSKTPEGKKDTSLLINKEDSSDKESVQEDQ